MTICKSCQKNEANQGNALCLDCHETLVKHLAEAKEKLKIQELSAAIEELEKVLAIQPQHQEAQLLKNQTEEKYQKISKLQLEIERCLKENQYAHAAAYLNELTELTPQDKNVKLQKQMVDLVTLTDPMTFVRKKHQHYKPSDWLSANYTIPSTHMVVGIAVGLIAGVVALIVSLSSIQSKNTPVDKSAQELYQKLQQVIAKKEYYNATFLADYQRLTRDYSNTLYADKIKQEFIRVSPEIVRGYLDKGNSYFSLGLYQQAIEEYTKVFAITPFNKEAADLIEAARSRMDLKTVTLSALPAPAAATAVPKEVSPPAEAAEEIPEADRQLLNAGMEYYQRGVYLKAIMVWQKASQQISSQQTRLKIEGFIEKARVLQRSQEREYAALVEQADMYSKRQSWKEAMVALERLMQMNPADPLITERIRRANYALNPPVISPRPQVKKNFFTPLQVFFQYRIEGYKKNKFKTYYEKALGYEAAKNYRQANYCYRKANQYYGLGPQFTKQIRVNRLIMALMQRLKQHPKDYNTSLCLGCLYYAKGWLEEAQKAWDAVEAQFGAKPGVLFLVKTFKAKAAEKRREFLIAQDLYADTLHSGNVFYVHNSLAKLFWQQDAVDEALFHWQEACARQPGQIGVVIPLAKAYLALSRRQELDPLLATLSNVTPLHLFKMQCAPQEVDPEYIAMVVTQDEYQRQLASDLSQLYLDMGNLADAMRWQQIAAGAGISGK